MEQNQALGKTPIQGKIKQTEHARPDPVFWELAALFLENHFDKTAACARRPTLVADAPDPGYLQGVVASAQRLEIVFWETDPATRVIIQDAKIIEQLAQVTNLCFPGVSTVRAPQTGYVFDIRVVPKKPGEPVHEFTLCERRLVFYGSENAYHAQLASVRFHYLLFREVYRNTKEGKEKSERLTFVRAYRLTPGEFHSTGNALAISHDGGVSGRRKPAGFPRARHLPRSSQDHLR